MRRFLSQLVDWLIASEPLLILIALPMLVFPRGYLWQWQHGVFHYAPIEDPSVRYPGALSWIGLALVALPWLLRWVRTGRPTRSTPLDAPIAIYLATAALSIWPSVDRAHSLSFLLLLIAGVAVYYGLVNAVANETQFKWALEAFLAGGVALSAIGLFQTDWTVSRGGTPFPVVYDWLSRLPSPLGRTLNEGITAGASVLFIPLGFALALVARRWWLRVVAATAALFITGFLLLTQSWGDILALALTGPALWLWLRRRGHLWLAGAILALTALIAGLVLYAPAVVDRIAYTYPSRWQVWERAAHIIRDHPLTGIGLDTFRPVAQNVYPFFNYAFDQTVNAHNRLLQVGADQGIVGLGAFVALVLLFYGANRVAWRAKPAARDRFHGAVALGICGGFTAFLLGSVFDDGVMTGRAGLALWYLVGLGVAQANLLAEGASLSKSTQVRWAWLRRPEAKGVAVVTALLLLAWAALTLPAVLWHNAGNVARNRGWLAVEASPGDREAHAGRALTFYNRAGRRALRDRGALIYLAHDGRRVLSGADFYEPVVARKPATEGLADLEAAAEERTGDRFAHYYLGEAYRAAGRLSDAAAEFRRAGVLVGWVAAEGHRLWNWGRGDAERALDHLLVAILMDPRDPEAYYALGLIHERQGAKDRAVVEYLGAADLYRDQGML